MRPQSRMPKPFDGARKRPVSFSLRRATPLRSTAEAKLRPYRFFANETVSGEFVLRKFFSWRSFWP